MYAKDLVETDRQIHHVAAGTGQLDYSFYPSLIAHGLSEQRTNRKRLLGVGVG